MQGKQQRKKSEKKRDCITKIKDRLQEMLQPLAAERQKEQRLKMGLSINDTQLIVELYADFYLGR